MRIVALAREMGAPATWLRNMNFADGSPGNTHTHGVLLGCDHNWPSNYQIIAQRRGYDGMGQGASGTPYSGQWGYGGKDPHPGPATYRTWQQGIAWAKAELAKLTAPAAPTGELTVGQIDDLLKVQNQILAEVKGLRSEESGRYKYYATKFNIAEALQRNVTANLSALEASLNAKGEAVNLEAFKAAAQEAFDSALESTLQVNIEAKTS